MTRPAACCKAGRFGFQPLLIIFFLYKVAMTTAIFYTGYIRHSLGC
jgi:hypothetical protein